MRPATPSPAFRSSLLALLRGEPPALDFPEETILGNLRRYECGGYLHHAWMVSGRAALLPTGWATALAAIHRKTSLDTLASLADFRVLAPHLRRADVPFVVLKGASYLVDLHDDPGCRVLSDIDLLVRREDAGRAARTLLAAGFRGLDAGDVPSRFILVPPGSERCQFEFHWSLGLPDHFRLDAEAIRARAERVALEGIACLRPAREDALLYHVAHLADHYFGPSLKWLLDLRAMFGRWRLDHAVVLQRATEWRVRAALEISLAHLDRVFPGAAPPALRTAVRSGGLRRRLLGRVMGTDVLEIAPEESAAGRLPMRWLTHDRHLDAARTLLLGALRRLSARLGGTGRRTPPPWEWRD